MLLVLWVLWVILVLLMLRRVILVLVQPSSLPISMAHRSAKAITVKWRRGRKVEKALELQDGLPFLQGVPAPGWPTVPRAWHLLLWLVLFVSGFGLGLGAGCGVPRGLWQAGGATVWASQPPIPAGAMPATVASAARLVAPPSHAAVRKLLSKVGGRLGAQAGLQQGWEGWLKQAVDSEHLDWSGTGLDSDDAKVVAHVVAVSGSLTTLWLAGNKIGNAGAAAIAEALRVNGALKELNLAWNNIGPNGGKALAEALRIKGINGSLDTLYLSNNKLGDAGAVAIADALRVIRLSLYA